MLFLYHVFQKMSRIKKQHFLQKNVATKKTAVSKNDRQDVLNNRKGKL